MAAATARQYTRNRQRRAVLLGLHEPRDLSNASDPFSDALAGQAQTVADLGTRQPLAEETEDGHLAAIEPRRDLSHQFARIQHPDDFAEGIPRVGYRPVVDFAQTVFGLAFRS